VETYFNDSVSLCYDLNVSLIFFIVGIPNTLLGFPYDSSHILSSKAFDTTTNYGSDAIILMKYLNHTQQKYDTRELKR
jgi:hypothetical protein